MNDWIVAHDATQGKKAYAIECLRCGEIQHVATPIDVTCYVAMGRAFEEMHQHCREPALAEARDEPN